MTATVRHLFRSDTRRALLRCPHCHVRTPLCAPRHEADEAATLLGVRRIRACLACGRSFATLEQAAVAGGAVLSVPVDTPSWALRLARVVVRLGCWIGGGR